MACCSCKNLDTKKKVDGVCSGVAYMCKKHKTYVLGCNDECDAFAKCSRDADTCDKIYREGEDWDNDRHSATFYIVIALILLFITLLVFLFNSNLYGI